MAFQPLSNRALCAACALLGLVSVSAPAAAQYYAAFPGATIAAVPSASRLLALMP